MIRWVARSRTVSWSVAASSHLLHSSSNTQPLCSHFSTEAVTAKSKKDALFLRALQVYYQREGHFSVPHEFIVPHTSRKSDASEEEKDKLYPWPEEVAGMDLGKRLRLFTRGRCGEYKRALLKSIGFPYEDWRTYVWKMQLLPALRTFRELEGHLFVRQFFEVPVGDERWPKSTWGFKLGSHCQLMRREKEEALPVEQVQMLNAMGFMWSEAEWKWTSFFLPALQRFREIYGHCEVPPRFIVPDQDPMWPERTWGYKLGNMVSQTRKDAKVESDNAADDDNKDSSSHESTTDNGKRSREEELQQLGFFTTDQAQTAWTTSILPSLHVFVDVYGHADIPADFQVPNGDDRWPESTWGLALGYIVQTMESHGIFAAQVQESKQDLKALCYRWDALFGKWSKKLLPALRHYKKLHDHCDVPQMFVVPANDTTWPEEMWGYRLGNQVSLLRGGGRAAANVQDELPELDAMGFSFNTVESAFVDKILPALEVYTQLYGDCNVPQGFVVPSEKTWPKRSWGIKLGHVVRNIRNRKQHAEQVEEYRDKLEAMGFVWRVNQSIETTNRDVVQPYVEIYKSIYGDDNVPRDFVILADDPEGRWPPEAHQFELGDWLYRYQRRQAGLLPFQTKEGRLANQMRRRRLKSQKGLSPYQEEYWKDVVLAAFQAYSKVYGSCEDMSDGFVVPREAPFPQSAWGLNLGLRLRHIRHGERYVEEVAKYRSDLEQLGVLATAYDGTEGDDEKERTSNSQE